MSYWNDDYFEVAMKAAFEAAGTMKCPSCGSRSCGYTPQTKIFDCNLVGLGKMYIKKKQFNF